MSPAGRRPRRQQSMPMAVPLTLVLVLVLGAVAIGVLNRASVQEAIAKQERRQSGAPSAPREPAVDPFAHLPPDRPPAPRKEEPRSGKPTVPSPDDLLEAPEWLEALALADEAEKHYEAAVSAKRAEDLSGAAEAGRQAREKFDLALEDTALWEEELLEQHGDRDPLVRKIQRTRNQWFQRVAWLRKSVGH